MSKESSDIIGKKKAGLLVIYGAKSIALGTYTAIRELYPEYSVECFLVTSLQGNPIMLGGLPVKAIREYAGSLMDRDKDSIHILIATPEDMQPEIAECLQRYGFCNYTCMDSHKESKLMERYFMRRGLFPSIRSLKKGNKKALLRVFLVRSHKDKPLKEACMFPQWTEELQAGASLADIRISEQTDHTGNHISGKNSNYCELTALYWIWKNRLVVSEENMPADTGYCGLFHYRRLLELSDEDLFRIRAGDADVILPFPTLHEPDIREHHIRYMKEEDWEAMLQALQELEPEYAIAFQEILKQPYLYNYNLIIAKRSVLHTYCSWLFPILERTEELSNPRGWERADRYIGYLGENLLTLYFLYNQKKLKIYHTGRLMLT